MNKKRSLFFDTNLIYFIVIIGFVGIRIASNLFKINNIVANILNISIQVVFMLLVPFLLYKLLRKKKTKEVLYDFNIKPIGFKAIILSVLIGFIVYFLNLAVASFFNVFIYGAGYDPSFGMASSSGSNNYPLVVFLFDVFISAVLPGICEEFCHRGMLLNGYKQLGLKKAILWVGILFGLMHLNIEQVFYASIIGIFLTFLVYVTGSIIPSIIIHFMNNFMGIYMVFANKNGLFLGNFTENLTNLLQEANFLTVILGVVFVVILMLGALAIFVYALMSTTRVQSYKKIAQKAINNKQREELFESFNLNAEDYTSKNQENLPQVVFDERLMPNGRRNVFINFQDDLLSGRIIKPTLKDKVFMYGTLFLGIFITISTFIWGIL